MRFLFIVLAVTGFHCSIAQKSIGLAAEFLSIAKANSQRVQFDFNDPLKFQWRRTPGPRNGVAIYEMTPRQKVLLHQLMMQSLTSAGYLKITHILFNEDLGKTYDPATGLNKYWFAIYGQPQDGKMWSWRLEGHHLSLNITYHGDKQVACTPFELGSFPATVENDTVRAGFRNLPDEVDVAFQLLHLLTEQQLEIAVLDRIKPNEKMMGELNTMPVKKPVGLRVSDMNEEQRRLIQHLVNVYQSNLRYPPAFDLSDAYFAWQGPTNGTGKYLYRIHGGNAVVELEDIGNHIHCLLRMTKTDFAENPFGN